ncbi:hypothetical protein ACCO45_008548 [Purpureocillium lilacinum]|uniref:Uncharacterized protein n=1 Tax=Purpureocillium lilacinum TaxID=33203 RepID=A0ACC4DNM2_PURLI
MGAPNGMDDGRKAPEHPSNFVALPPTTSIDIPGPGTAATTTTMHASALPQHSRFVCCGALSRVLPMG